MIIRSSPISILPSSILFLCTLLLFLVPRTYIHCPSVIPTNGQHCGDYEEERLCSHQRLLRFRICQASPILARWRPPSWAPTQKPRCETRKAHRGIRLSGKGRATLTWWGCSSHRLSSSASGPSSMPWAHGNSAWSLRRPRRWSPPA